MADPFVSGNLRPQAPIPFDRARAVVPLPQVPQQPPAGSLVMIDDFRDTCQDAAHGNVGAYAARQQGYRGNIYAESIGSDAVTGPDPSIQAELWLSLGPQDPAATRQAVQDISRFRHKELLHDVTGDLNKVRDRGLHDSAVNVSYAISPQRVAQDLYQQVKTNTNPGSPRHQFSANITRAYGIDPAKLDSQDPGVSGPERSRLQQALLDAAEAGLHSPDVAQAQQSYDQAVHSVLSRNNSVVVSAGNQEQILEELAADAGGRRPRVAADSNHNVLANHEVTTVGATRWYQNGSERLAAYSSRDPEVDIYASGSVGNGADPQRMKTAGTSFASPRVAATLATLHGTHQGATRSAMENLMRNRLTHQVSNAPVLDYQRTEEYMRSQTF